MAFWIAGTLSFVSPKYFLLLSSVRTGVWTCSLLLSGVSQGVLFLHACCFCLMFASASTWHSHRSELAEISRSSYLDASTRLKGFPRHPRNKMHGEMQVGVCISTEYTMEVMYSIKSEKQASEIHYSFVEKTYQQTLIKSYMF